MTDEHQKIPANKTPSIPTTPESKPTSKLSPGLKRRQSEAKQGKQLSISYDSLRSSDASIGSTGSSTRSEDELSSISFESLDQETKGKDIDKKPRLQRCLSEPNMTSSQVRDLNSLTQLYSSKKTELAKVDPDLKQEIDLALNELKDKQSSQPTKAFELNLHIIRSTIENLSQLESNQQLAPHKELIKATTFMLLKMVISPDNFEQTETDRFKQPLLRSMEGLSKAEGNKSGRELAQKLCALSSARILSEANNARKAIKERTGTSTDKALFELLDSQAKKIMLAGNAYNTDKSQESPLNASDFRYFEDESSNALEKDVKKRARKIDRRKKLNSVNKKLKNLKNLLDENPAAKTQRLENKLKKIETGLATIEAKLEKADYLSERDLINKKSSQLKDRLAQNKKIKNRELNTKLLEDKIKSKEAELAEINNELTKIDNLLKNQRTAFTKEDINLLKETAELLEELTEEINDDADPDTIDEIVEGY